MRSIHTSKEGDKERREYYTEDKSLGKGKDSSKKVLLRQG